MTYFNDTYDEPVIEDTSSKTFNEHDLEAIILNLLPSDRYELLRRADCYHVLDTFTGAVLSIQRHTIVNNRGLLITMIAAYLKRCNHGA